MEVRCSTLSSSVPRSQNMVPIMKHSMVYMKKRTQNTPGLRRLSSHARLHSTRNCTK